MPCIGATKFPPNLSGTIQYCLQRQCLLKTSMRLYYDSAISFSNIYLTDKYIRSPRDKFKKVHKNTTHKRQNWGHIKCPSIIKLVNSDIFIKWNTIQQ